MAVRAIGFDIGGVLERIAPVDEWLGPHEARLAKPDPRAYALLCAELNVAPDELVFVDDVPANVEAARQLGVHGVLHQSAAGTISEITRLLAT